MFQCLLKVSLSIISSCVSAVHVIVGTGDVGTPVGTPGGTSHPDYHYSITTNTSFTTQQPQGIMQMQLPVVQAQQAATPTGMQTQNPVIPVQQGVMQQPVVMQVQQPGMPMQQPLMPVQQQGVMPPNQQSTVVLGHQPTTLQIQPQQQQQAGGVGTPLSNLPLSQRIPLLPTPMVGSPSSIPVTQQQMIQQQQQVIPSPSSVNGAHYSSTSYVTHNT